MCSCVCVCSERASFQALLALPLSLAVSRRLSVYLAVLESVLYDGAQKAQRILKDTWPALPTATLTSTANANKTVVVRGGLVVWAKQRCAALHCALPLPLPLPLQAALRNSCFLLSVCAMHCRTSAVRANSCCCRVRQRSAHAYASVCVRVFINT